MSPFNLLSGLQILIDPIEGYYLQEYYGSFCHEDFHPPTRKGILVILCYTAFQYGKKLLLPTGHGPWESIGNLLLSLLFLLLLGVCLYRDARPLHIFLAVSFMSIQETGRIFTLIFPYLTDLPVVFLRWYESRGHAIGEPNAFLFVMLTVDGVWIFAYGFRILLLRISLRNIRKQLCERMPSAHPAKLQYLLLPALTASCINLLFNLILFRSDGHGTEEFLFDMYPVLRLFVPVLLLLSLASILYGVRLFQHMVILHQEQSNQAVLEEQLKSMQEYLQEDQRIRSGIRSMKHDMKNTLSVIAHLAQKEPERRNTELCRYLSDLEQSLEELEYRFQTGNTVVDALLNMKYHEAVLRIPGLDLQADALLFPDTFHISGYDAGVIIGNALDNAVEACLKYRAENPDAAVYIRLSSFQRRNLFFIEIENSFHGRLACKEGAEFPVSTSRKDPADLHGIGLSNIKKAAEKYEGAVIWKAADGVFLLSVMLKNRP